MAGIGQALAARGRLLLILDNAEGAVAALRAAVPAWLDAAPRLSCLVTSRGRIGIDGEAVLALGPLAPGEARASLLARARQRSLALEIAPHQVAALDEVLQRLDHLPLAIELAGARLAVIGPERLAREGIEWLAPAPVDAVGRQRTMGDAVAWSWALLDGPQRALLARASVFAGGCDLDAARAVCARAATDAPRNIPDNSAASVTSSIPVSADGTVSAILSQAPV